MTFSTEDAAAILAGYNKPKRLNAIDVVAALENVKGVSFGQCSYVRVMGTAAAHKQREILKVVRANVQLFNSIQDYRNVYEAAVKRSATKLGRSDPALVAAFESQGNYFEHTRVHSIVFHKTQERYYLYCIYNNSEAHFYVDGVLTDRKDLEQYMTPSQVRELNNTKTTTNQTYDITHDVIVRTISLNSIVELKVKGVLLTLNK